MNCSPVQAWTQYQGSMLGHCNSDRYIPFRRKLNIDLTSKSSPATPTASPPSHTAIKTDSPLVESRLTDSSMDDFDLKIYRKRLSIAMDQRPLKRVLSFSSPSQDSASPRSPYPVPYHPFGFAASSSLGEETPSPPRRRRQIPRDPYKVLALPEIRDDFYCNTMDWGSNDVLALALGNSTFVWNAAVNTTQSVDGLDSPSLEQERRGSGSEEPYVSSVKWSPDCNYLAVGRSQGLVQLYDAHTHQDVGTSSQISKKHIGCMDWRQHVLYCGSRDGYIHVLDDRARMKQQALMRAKRRFEITSLQLSPDQSVLASGSDDGYVRLWCMRSHALLYEMDAHMSSIKALAWCPWRTSLLASGGGCNDGRLVLWNRNLGQAVHEQETHMQICSMAWSTDYKELVTSHGYPSNDLLIWAVHHDTVLTRTSTLSYHQGRPLHLALSPDKTTLASAGADETLCFWKLFPASKTKMMQRSPLDLFALR